MNRQPRTVSRRRSPSPRAARARRGLVPRDGVVRVQDRGLVALAREQDHVARPGPGEGGRDGRAPVGDGQDVLAPAAARGLGAADDLPDDRVAVLAPRVLVGRRSRCGSARPAIRPMAARLAVSRSPAEPKTAISEPPLRRGDGRQQVQHHPERRRRVRVVDDDAERLARVDPLHAARHAGRPLPAPRGRRPDRGPSASPSATTASALWTLKRPARRRVERRPAPDGAS